MNHPKVSICIPAYNAPDSLRRSLDSVKEQESDDYEVIITDDTSDESVKRCVDRYAGILPIRYYKNTQRKGSPGNWNESVRHAKGEYIKLLHHDDWFSHKDSLSQFVSMLEGEKKADFGFSASNAFDADLKLKYIHYPDKRILSKLKRHPEELFPRNIIGAPSATIYRATVRQEFDTKLKWVVDVDFYVRVLLDNANFVYREEPLININASSFGKVTNDCIDSRELQLFEWVYLYQAMNKGLLPRCSHMKFIRHLLRKYDVRSTDELIHVGLGPKLRWEIGLFTVLNMVTQKAGVP